MPRIVAECCECCLQSETGEEFDSYFGGRGVCRSCEDRIETEESRPELARLRAIEAAAREYRTAYQRNDIWGDEWQIACIEHRSRLFALLDSAPTA